MSRPFRKFRIRRPSRLPGRWLVVLAVAYLALALAFVLLLVGPRLGVILTSHAQPATVTATTIAVTATAAVPAAGGYTPVPAGPPSTPTGPSTDTSAGRP